MWNTPKIVVAPAVLNKLAADRLKDLQYEDDILKLNEFISGRGDDVDDEFQGCGL